MVLGFIIATGIETVVELGFWGTRKMISGIYYMIYGKEEEEENVEDLKSLRKEISELKEIIKKQTDKQP